MNFRLPVSGSVDRIAEWIYQQAHTSASRLLQLLQLPQLPLPSLSRHAQRSLQRLAVCQQSGTDAYMYIKNNAYDVWKGRGEA